LDGADGDSTTGLIGLAQVNLVFVPEWLEHAAIKDIAVLAVVFVRLDVVEFEQPAL
jgi:hypothetical protein